MTRKNQPCSMTTIVKFRRRHRCCRYRQTPTGVTKVTTETDDRYSLTNGRFSFQDPQESKDAGLYFCVAENTFGSIKTSAVRVSFGCKCLLAAIALWLWSSFASESSLVIVVWIWLSICILLFIWMVYVFFSASGVRLRGLMACVVTVTFNNQLSVVCSCVTQISIWRSRNIICFFSLVADYKFSVSNFVSVYLGNTHSLSLGYSHCYFFD